MCIRLVVEETFKIVFSNRPALRTWGKSQINEIRDQVSPLNKSHLSIEIRLYSLSLYLGLHEVAGISIGSLFERNCLDHRADILQDAEGQSVLGFNCCAGQ